MRNGDCPGALEAFDTVLRTAVAPDVNRDRGLCREKLGLPFPAADDYRAYLTARPDAPDADGIRERLVRLEQESTGRSSASRADIPDDATDASVAPADGADGAQRPHSDAGRDGVDGVAVLRDKMDSVDRDDDSEARSPLRGRKGWAVAPFFAEHKWLGGPQGDLGDAVSWAECAGLQLRYSFGRSGALLVEAGYEHFNATTLDDATRSGLSSLLAYELDFPLDADFDNQLFFAPGLGYQHLVSSPNDPQKSSESMGAFVPRLRFGYRHMLGAAVALDIHVDAGITQYFAYAKFPYDSSADLQELVGLGVALLWGL
jgi:hypothetical protein